MSKSSNALAHLTRHYNDSDADSDEDSSSKEIDEIDEDGKTGPDEIKNKHTAHLIDPKIESTSNSPANMLGLSFDSLTNNSRIIDDDMFEPDLTDRFNDEHSEEINRKEQDIKEDKLRPMSPTKFHLSLQGKSLEIEIPPEPSGQPSQELVEKINYLHEKMRQGKDMKASIEKRKDFRNPSIYEKLIVFCDIDELGTNYPPDIYDPHKWGPEAYYDELARKQKEEMDKKDRERKERTKVEFVTGTAKKSSSNENAGHKKTKWDVSSSASKVGALIPGLSIRPSLVGSSIISSLNTAQSTSISTRPPVFTIKGTK